MKLESALAGSEIVGSFRSVGSAVALAGSFGLVCCANSDLRMTVSNGGCCCLNGIVRSCLLRKLGRQDDGIKEGGALLGIAVSKRRSVLLRSTGSFGSCC